MKLCKLSRTGEQTSESHRMILDKRRSKLHADIFFRESPEKKGHKAHIDTFFDELCLSNNIGCKHHWLRMWYSFNYWIIILKREQISEQMSRYSICYCRIHDDTLHSSASRTMAYSHVQFQISIRRWVQ